MGHQTPMESVHRHHQDQALVDCHHAVAHRCCPRWCRLHHPSPLLAARVVSLLLADGLRQRHPRHCCRRLLYARPRTACPGLFCGYTKYVLSHRHHRRTRLARDAGWQSRGHHPQREILLESDVLRYGRPLHRLLAVAPLHSATPQGGHTGIVQACEQRRG